MTCNATYQDERSANNSSKKKRRHLRTDNRTNNNSAKMWTAGAEANIGIHAKTRWEDLLRFGGGPQSPVASSEEPEIYRAARRPTVRILHDDGQIREESVYLMRGATDPKSSSRAASPPDHCYRRIPRKKTVKVQFGHLIYAMQLDRMVPPSSPSAARGGGAQLPPPLYHVNINRYHMVAIKKQNKELILDYLRRGGHENPFLNILRMQQLGDDVHVLKCLEALHDEKYLYTIMPLCRTRNIMESLENLSNDAAAGDEDDGVDPVEAKARTLFRAVLENLHYLHSFNICHHDLSPDNILETHEGRLVLVDLAMSLEMPMSDASGEVRHRTVILPNGVYGKPPYMSPEVFMNHNPFDGCYLDVWAAGCILYNLLTQRLVCNQPHPTDILFKYFIMAQGLSNEAMNERTVEILIDLYKSSDQAAIEDKQSLLDRAMVHLNLSPQVMELLAGILHWNPLERWTLADVMQSDWVQNNSSFNNDDDDGLF